MKEKRKVYLENKLVTKHEIILTVYFSLLFYFACAMITLYVFLLEIAKKKKISREIIHAMLRNRLT